MLTDEDIKKIQTVIKEEIVGVKTDVALVRQDVAEVKSDISDLRELVQGLIVSCDSMAKAINDLKLEYTGIVHQLNRHDDMDKATR